MSKQKKDRIDLLLVKKGFFESREQAKREIMAGNVFVKTERIDKPGTRIDVDEEIIVKGDKQKYVSRGGLKLEKAIEHFNIHLNGVIALDIGASTGGFTDCMLQKGALKVYAVDVGYNQLAWKLRKDERVIVKERYNFRYATPEDFLEGQPTFASIDVSFISLRLILPPLAKIMKQPSTIVALVKPQFEAGKGEVGKRGIVRDATVHVQVLEQIITFAHDLGYLVSDLTYSPITGGEGNIEFLMLLTWPTHKGGKHTYPEPAKIVREAHEHLL